VKIKQAPPGRKRKTKISEQQCYNKPIKRDTQPTAFLIALTSMSKTQPVTEEPDMITLIEEITENTTENKKKKKKRQGKNASSIAPSE